MNFSQKPFWLHCNFCFNREAQKYKMTNCGIVLCDSEKCLGVVTTRMCKDCQGPCKRLKDLDTAPEEVLSLFEPISAQISRSVIPVCLLILHPVFSTLIGRAMSRLSSHWSRGSQFTVHSL